MKIDGRCHCGQITYEADVDPDQAFICSCADCQTLSGSAFRTVILVPEAQFILLSGKPRVYVKTGESGARRQQTFCADCGTPLYSAAADGDGPKVLGLRAGTARQRDQLAPKKIIWARSALGWLPSLGSIARIDKQ